MTFAGQSSHSLSTYMNMTLVSENVNILIAHLHLNLNVHKDLRTSRGSSINGKLKGNHAPHGDVVWSPRGMSWGNSRNPQVLFLLKAENCRLGIIS